jgi:hypothetical protein
MINTPMAVENDIVLIHFENQPLAFARIEEILPDKKKDWYHVRLLILQIPLQTVTWILRDAYINGQEFTMDGKKMRLEKIVAPQAKIPTATHTHKQSPGNSSAVGGKGTIIPLAGKKPGTKTTPR